MFRFTLLDHKTQAPAAKTSITALEGAYGAIVVHFYNSG